MWISGTAAIPILERGYSFYFGGGKIGTIPVLLLWMLLFGIVGLAAGQKLLVCHVASASQRYVSTALTSYNHNMIEKSFLLTSLSQQCDGVRPECKCCIAKATPCSYSVVSPGVTQQQAVKNELDAYKRVLTLIRESNPTDADALVKIIKERDSLNDAVQDIQS